jgi:hypothetical protein
MKDAPGYGPGLMPCLVLEPCNHFEDHIRGPGWSPVTMNMDGIRQCMSTGMQDTVSSGFGIVISHWGSIELTECSVNEAFATFQLQRIIWQSDSGAGLVAIFESAP